MALKLATKAGRAIAEYRAAWNEAAGLWQHLHRSLITHIEALGLRGRAQPGPLDGRARVCSLSRSQSRPRMRYLIGHRDRWRWTV